MNYKIIGIALLLFFSISLMSVDTYAKEKSITYEYPNKRLKQKNVTVYKGSKKVKQTNYYYYSNTKANL